MAIVKCQVWSTATLRVQVLKYLASNTAHSYDSYYRVLKHTVFEVDPYGKLMALEVL